LVFGAWSKKAVISKSFQIPLSTEQALLTEPGH